MGPRAAGFSTQQRLRFNLSAFRFMTSSELVPEQARTFLWCTCLCHHLFERGIVRHTARVVPLALSPIILKCANWCNSARFRTRGSQGIFCQRHLGALPVCRLNRL